MDAWTAVRIRPGLLNRDFGHLIDIAEKIGVFIRKGYSKEQIKKEIPETNDAIFNIARARINNDRSKKVNPLFLFDEESLRFATAENVADYRAKRLKCKTIVDVGCGIGIQAIAFAKACKKVVAIDNDKSRIEFAEYNAKIAKRNNIDFIEGDALEVLDKIKSADIVFWDPERPPAEEERSLDSFSPSFDRLIKQAGRLTSDICVELPPQIAVDKIKIPCELEYLSFGKKLCRLNAYFGSLKKAGVSAVCLETGARIEADHSESIKLSSNKVSKKFIYDIDRAVVKAGLVPALVRSLKKEAEIIEFAKRPYLVSDSLIRNDFIEGFEVLGSTQTSDLNRFLSVNGFGKCILRGKISEKDYWNIKKGVEKGLSGDRFAYAFINGNSAVVCRSVNSLG